MDSSRPPWERQPGETGKAFSAFRAYLTLGAARSVESAYRRVTGCKKRVSGTWWGWSSRNRWVERAAAFDAEEWRQRLVERRVTIAQAERRILRSILASPSGPGVLDRLVSVALGEGTQVVAGRIVRPDPAEVDAIRLLMDAAGIGPPSPIRGGTPTPILYRPTAPAPDYEKR